MEDRLSRLERTVRYQRLILLSLLALVAILGFKQGTENLKTNSLEILNKQGKPSALFYGTEEGFEGYIYGRAVEGADYRPSLKLEGGRAGGQIDLFDESGMKVMELTRGTDGGAITIFHNDTKQPVASVYASRDGGARIELNAANGSERMYIESTQHNSAIKFSQPSGAPALSIYSLLDGGYIALFDEKGNSVQNLPKKN
jgi:hypothetical protein